MQHKDFDAARAEATGEAVSFTLGGEEFTIPQPVPILPILDMASIDPETETEQGSIAAFRDLLFGMLNQEDIPRFRKACETARADTAVLGEIVKWIIEVTTRVPLEQPTDSPPPASGTGDISNTISERTVLTSLG